MGRRQYRYQVVTDRIDAAVDQAGLQPRPGDQADGQRVQVAVRDLRDVVTRLSRLGFVLSAVSGLTSGVAEERVLVAVDDVDDLIRLVRRVVVELADGESDGNA